MIRWGGRIGVPMTVGLVAAALLAALWGVELTINSSNRDAAVRAAYRQNQNIAAALEEHTLRVLSAADQATLRVADGAKAAGRTAGLGLVRIANETGLAPDILVQLATVGADGRMADSNLDPNAKQHGPVDLSEREHIRVHLQGPQFIAPASLMTPGGLFIGKPVLGKVSHKWTIQLSRRLQDAAGNTLGVVVASVDPGYFEQIFAKVSMGGQSGIGLLGRDLMYRARVVGGQPTGMGVSLAPGSVHWNPDENGQGSHLVRNSQINALDLFVSYHNIRGYPLRLQVFESTDEALYEWRRARDAVLMLAALLSLGIVLAALLVATTVRRIEASNASLRDSEARARSANQAKSEFLSAMSHELRTPLTSIQGFSHLMERRAPDPLQREQAMLIRKASEHLGELLNGILDLAKIEAGAMRVDAQPCELVPLVRDVVELFALPAQDKSLLLAARIAPDTPGIITVDSLRLKQILNNLLSNAVKFTQSGSITLEVAPAAGGRVVFAVVDTGDGIGPEMRELVFERFRQGDRRVSYRYGGTGLGLSLSRSLAQMMGGDVQLASSGPAGSRFELTLPVEPEATDAESTPATTASAERGKAA
jgi:signal transduction histidine kinase